MYLKSEGLWTSALFEAGQLETDILDNLRFHAGQLGLKESRKSTNLKNRQLREGKWSKLPEAQALSLSLTL